MKYPEGKPGAYTIPASIASFTVDTANSYFSSVAGVLFNKSHSTLLQYPKGKPGIYDIPTHVTAIVDQAFKDCIGLTKVTIPYTSKKSSSTRSVNVAA